MVQKHQAMAEVPLCGLSSTAAESTGTVGVAATRKALAKRGSHQAELQLNLAAVSEMKSREKEVICGGGGGGAAD